MVKGWPLSLLANNLRVGLNLLLQIWSRHGRLMVFPGKFSLSPGVTFGQRKSRQEPSAHAGASPRFVPTASISGWDKAGC